MPLPSSEPVGATFRPRSLAGAVERLRVHVARIGREPTHAGGPRDSTLTLLTRPVRTVDQGLAR